MLVTDPNEQMRQFVHLLNQSAAHLKTAINYCLCARRTAGWSEGSAIGQLDRDFAWFSSVVSRVITRVHF
jgi:hypothetical protein